MSRENVEVVRRAVDAWNAGDLDSFLELTDENIEVSFPPDVPEPGPFHGRKELRAWAEQFLSAWVSFQAEIREVWPLEENVVLALYQHGRGRDTGIAIERTDWHVMTVRTGRIARWFSRQTRDEALEAVGLREEESQRRSLLFERRPKAPRQGRRAQHDPERDHAGPSTGEP